MDNYGKLLSNKEKELIGLLKLDETAVVLIDVQGKLAEIVHESEQLLDSTEKLIKGAQILEVPILWLEQYPKGLGPTKEQLKQHLTDQTPIEKIAFSGCKCDEFQEQLKKLDKKSYLVAGIETHICVYQTVSELLAQGKEVEIVVDCVSSRTLANKEIGIEKMKQLGAKVTSVEMALFELMETAKHPKFKEISNLIK